MSTQVADPLRAWLQAGRIDQVAHDQLGALLAQVHGSGAIADDNAAQAVGQGGVGIQGDSHGPVNTGLQIHHHAAPPGPLKPRRVRCAWPA